MKIQEKKHVITRRTYQDFSGINRDNYWPELVAGNSNSSSQAMARAAEWQVFVSDGTEEGTYLIQDRGLMNISSNGWWDFYFVGPRDLHVILFRKSSR